MRWCTLLPVLSIKHNVIKLGVANSFIQTLILSLQPTRGEDGGHVEIGEWFVVVTACDEILMKCNLGGCNMHWGITVHVYSIIAQVVNDCTPINIPYLATKG